MSDPTPPQRSRYYDAVLSTLDRVVQPELSSEGAKFTYAAVRRMLANLAVANENTPHLPEHLASYFAAAEPRKAPSSGNPVLDALMTEGDLLDIVEEKVHRRLNPAPAVQAQALTSSTLTEDRVQAALQRRLGPEAVVRKFRPLTGGRSKQTIILTLDMGKGEPVDRVIRRDLIVEVTGTSVVDEYAVLAALAERGLPVPRPLYLETDTAAVGSAYMLMEKVEGATAGDVFDPPESCGRVLASASELARLHAVPVDEIVPTLRVDRRIAPDAQGLLKELGTLQQTLKAQVRAPSATLDAAFSWLADSVSAIQWHRSVVHGDYSFHNIMFNGEDVSAIMDWELVRAGHPAEDLGYIRAAVSHRLPWADFMAAYVEAGGVAIPHRTILFYSMLAKLRLLTLLLRARGFFERGYTDELQLADVSMHHVARVIHQLSVDTRAAYRMAS